MAKHWKNFVEGVRTEDIIAMKIPKGAIRGFSKQDIVIEPNEAAVIIRDGKIEDTLTQTKLKGFGGGFGGWLERISGKGEDEVLLFVDTGIKELEFLIKQTSKDFAEVQGVCTLRFQININDATKVIGLMSAKETLGKTDLEIKLRPELVANIFSPEIAKYNIDEFHGNINIVKGMENTAITQMKRTFETWGLSLVKLFTNWEKGAYDELMEYRRTMAMMEERKDIDMSGRLGDLRREHENLKKRQEYDYNLKLGEVSGEETLKTTRTEREVGREKIQYDEQLRQYKTMREAETEGDWKELQHALEAKRQLDEMQIKRFQETELAREKTDQEFKMRQMGMQDATQKQMLDLLKQSGQVSPEVLQEMLRQQTIQKMADREAEKVKAVSEAEKARYELGTYKEAEERERKHEVERRKADAELMKAAKQELPRTLVQGPATPVVAVREEVKEKEEASVCPECGEPIKEKWKICPSCAAKLE